VSNWPERGSKKVQDYWRELKSDTRRFCKGWGANINSQIKKDKKILMDKMKRMDKMEEETGFNTIQWQERYGVEKQLEEIYQFEEIQWQRRWGVKWVLKGDSNNSYFHGMPNGRKKKCTIFSLEDEGRGIRDPTEIRNHVESYYKDLFGVEPEGGVTLGEEFWLKKGRLCNEEAQELIKPFYH
jgi:hypothetical protein